MTILVPKIKKDTLISYNRYRGYITGAVDNRIFFSNAVQWFSGVNTDKYVKGLFKLLDMEKKGFLSKERWEDEEFLVHVNRFDKKKLVINREKNKELYETILSQVGLEIYQSISAFQTLKKVMETKKGIFEKKTVLIQAKS